ncbi:MAG: TlpA family protein disulfide reductase [Actinobacteria bacterium]|nr:TlpA family protein disulfide reductase [Actinomycetota bacterium]
MKFTRRTSSIAAVSVVAVIGLAACGSATESQMATDSTPPSPTVAPVSPGQAAPVSQAILPAVTVRNVRSGTNVDLATLTQAGTPTLVWAWAPHCPYCNAEAPKVQEFASANTGKVNVVGVGTQDSFGQAEDFVSKHDLTAPTMVWDESFQSWTVMGITSMPTWILLGPDGEQLLRWSGQFPESDIASKI